MKIIRLRSENVKKITAVEIAPGDGAMVGVAGMNDAGKSSVLDSIAYALGGKDLTPPEPIRAGETEAQIEIDLGDLIVVRKFRRSRLECDCKMGENPGGEGGSAHQHTCAILKFGETTSTLVVKNREGAIYPSPQKMLDKLLGRLTFDPLAFMREAKDDPKKAAETLRRLAGLDFSALDARRLEASQNRAALKRVLGDVVARINAMPQFYEATADEIPISEITAEMQKAEELRAAAHNAAGARQQAARELDEIAARAKGIGDEIISIAADIARLQELLAGKQTELAQWQDAIRAAEGRLAATVAAMAEAQAAVPDASAIGERMKQVEDNNQKVRANAARLHSEAEGQRISARLNATDEAVKACDDERAAAMAEAAFPVDGLGLGEDGVTWRGLPLEQASQSEKLRVSVAIGLALNPRLRVLLVRDGSLLDGDGVATIAAMAEAAGAQVWCEFVGDGGEGMAVVMEDGHAK